jgi:V8-like Glu-specific endopeptidase
VKTRLKFAAQIVGLLYGAALLGGVAFAQSSSDAAVRSYWTSERLRNAIPMDHHPAAVGADGLPASVEPKANMPTPDAVSTGTERSRTPNLPASNPSTPPSVSTTGPQSQLYRPKSTALSPTPDATTTAYKKPFTTFRVFPKSGSTAAVLNFPYSAVGHLFFTITKSGGIDPPGNYQCSASVIKLRIVATAGHCVGSPKTATGGNFFWYTNWLFVPADINGTAPYGSWTAFSQGASGPWSNGDGSLPNAEDWGFLAMNDGGNGVSGTKLGNVTGTLGYLTLSLAPNNLVTLGYPANLDNGAYMEQNHGATAGAAANNTWTIGSAMGAGSSGGPWIMNFGEAPKCNGPCLAANGSTNTLGGNYMVAVNSYGPNSGVGYSGASQFNTHWTSLLTTMCAKKAGSC